MKTWLQASFWQPAPCLQLVHISLDRAVCGSRLAPKGVQLLCSFPPCSAKWCSGTFLPVFFFIFHFCVKVHSLFEVQRPLCCQSNTTLSPSPIPLTFLSCKNGLLWFCRAVKELSLCLKGEAVPVKEMDAYKLLRCFS